MKENMIEPYHSYKNFNPMDRELENYFQDYDYCVQDACIYYLTMVYDLWAKLQDDSFL